MNGDIQYQLGKINARLDTNDQVHYEIKTLLEKMDGKLDTACGDMIALKTKAKIWGAIAGFIASAVLTVIGWVTFK